VTRSLGTKNGDIYLDKSGNLAVHVGLDAVLQACEQVCKTRKGELIFDVNSGVPFFETALKTSRGFQQFEAAIRVAILAVPDVTTIKKIEIVQEGDVLKYTATIQTIYGAGAISG
jgi:hypothetical protein